MLRAVLLSVCLTLAFAQESSYGQAGEEPYYYGEGPYYGGEGEEPYYGGGDEYYGGEGSYGGGPGYETGPDPDYGSDNMFGDMDISMLMGMGTFQYDVWGEIIKNMPFDEILDNSTSSGLVPGFESVWKMLKSDMCYSTADTCDAAMFLDCNCIKKFTTMKNSRCNTVLCDIYQGVWDNLANWINNIRTLNSFEEFMAYANEEILTDIMGYMCDCQDEIFRSAVSCVSKYDSPMLKSMMGEEAAYNEFKSTMKKINWKAIQNLLENILGHMCSSVNSVECYYSYFTMWENTAALFDNTFSGAGTSCNSFVDIIKWVSEMDEPEENMSSIMSAVFKVQKRWVCNKKCAQDKLDMFLSDCCIVGVSQDKKIINGFISIVNNIMPIVMDMTMEGAEGMPKKLTRQCKKQLRTMADPIQMCSANKNTSKTWSNVISNCKNEGGSFYDAVEAFKKK